MQEGNSQSFEEMAADMAKGLRPENNTDNRQWTMDQVDEKNNDSAKVRLDNEATAKLAKEKDANARYDSLVKELSPESKDKLLLAIQNFRDNLNNINTSSAKEPPIFIPPELNFLISEYKRMTEQDVLDSENERKQKIDQRVRAQEIMKFIFSDSRNVDTVLKGFQNYHIDHIARTPAGDPQEVYLRSQVKSAITFLNEMCGPMDRAKVKDLENQLSFATKQQEKVTRKAIF